MFYHKMLGFKPDIVQYLLLTNYYITPVFYITFNLKITIGHPLE